MNTGCYIHGASCFVDWEEIHNAIKDVDYRDSAIYGDKAPFWLRHEIAEHIALSELTDPFDGEVIGPATAIARLHSLRSRRQYTEADAIKETYHIMVAPGGYIALTKRG